MIEYWMHFVYSSCANDVDAQPKYNGAIKLQTLDKMTHIHVVIARNRFINADPSFVSLGQKYGFNNVNIADLDNIFFFLGGGSDEDVVDDDDEGKATRRDSNIDKTL